MYPADLLCILKKTSALPKIGRSAAEVHTQESARALSDTSWLKGPFQPPSQKDVEVRLDLGFSIAQNFLIKRQQKRIWIIGDEP